MWTYFGFIWAPSHQIQFGKIIAVSFCFDLLACPSKSIKKFHFYTFFWPKKPNNHPKWFFRVPELKSKANQTCPTFRGITFDSVELQKWSCNLKKPQTICQKLAMYLYGARAAHCGMRDYFLKSGQANFCRIRYSSTVHRSFLWYSKSSRYAHFGSTTDHVSWILCIDYRSLTDLCALTKKIT